MLVTLRRRMKWVYVENVAPRCASAVGSAGHVSGGWVRAIFLWRSRSRPGRQNLSHHTTAHGFIVVEGEMS